MVAIAVGVAVVAFGVGVPVSVAVADGIADAVVVGGPEVVRAVPEQAARASTSANAGPARTKLSGLTIEHWTPTGPEMFRAPSRHPRTAMAGPGVDFPEKGYPR
jgi:hypothetical protein